MVNTINQMVKKMISKIILYAFVFWIIIMIGCVTNVDNSIPVLTNTLPNITMEMNDSLLLGTEIVEAYDNDGDELFISVDEGDNYVLNGNTLIPDKGFFGDLLIGLRVFDGKLYSNRDTLIVSVLSTLQLLPLLEGAWWQYTDFIPQRDTALQSRLEVGNMVTFSQISDLDSAYEICWSHLEESICYIMSSTNSAVTLLGGIGSDDTSINVQCLYKYPVSSDENWKYQPLRYNVTDKKFVWQEKEREVSVTNSSVYITVPAGIFNCIEYTEIAVFATESDKKTETKIYYSPGVGYVKMVTIENGKIVWKKELIDYNVEKSM